MKDIIKYSAAIFAIILLVYLGVNIYNFKSKSNVKKNDNYTQALKKKDNNSSMSIKEEKEYNEEKISEESKENKQDSKDKDSKQDSKDNKKENNNESKKKETKETKTSDNTNNQTSDKPNNSDNDNKPNNNDTSTQEEKHDTSKQFTATFYIGKKLYAENCTTTGDTCKVKSPTISAEGYEVLGWSTNSNSKTAEFNNSSEITLNSNKTFYAIMKKKINITFTNGKTNTSEVKSCYIYNDETGCEVTSPEISTTEDYIALGWANNLNERQSSWSTKTNRKVSESKTYYSVIRRKTPLRVAFVVQDDKAATTSSVEELCYLYNNETSCKIVVPTLKAKSNAEVLGWNADSNAKTVTQKGGETLSITENKAYYSISKLKVIVTFNRNTSFNKNTVGKNNSSYNPSLENIAAEWLSFTETSCESYNGKGCKINKVPATYSIGNEIRGFSKTTDGAPINVYQTVFKENTTLYARIYNNANRGTLNTYYYGTLGNMPVEMDANLNQQSRNIYWNYLNQLYSDMPQLFDPNGKITLLAESTYSSVVSGSSAGITGGHVPNVLINIPTNVVLDTEREATIVHELAHAFGDIYGRKTGNYPENNQEILSIYNKYKTYSLKPLREYAYVHINEFFAEMFRFAYEEKYHRGTGIGSPVYGYTYKTTPDIMKIVDRYLCVARNNYNEQATGCR